MAEFVVILFSYLKVNFPFELFIILRILLPDRFLTAMLQVQQMGYYSNQTLIRLMDLYNLIIYTKMENNMVCD